MSDAQGPFKAYKNLAFINSSDARPLRILAEYLEPEARFRDQRVFDTIVFFGSARIKSPQAARADLEEAKRTGGDMARAERIVAMSHYHEAARTLSARITEWSKNIEGHRRRFVVCTGGGPGIMEAANQGASEAKGVNVGLGITLPREESNNPFITRQLAFEFHYFFMRKFWFAYLAKGLVVFPGGFGTLDELFELMTLAQTGKMHKRVPVVLFGRDYWDTVLNLEAMVDFGTIDAKDLDLFFKTDSVDEAFDYLTSELAKEMDEPSGKPGSW